MLWPLLAFDNLSRLIAAAFFTIASYHPSKRVFVVHIIIYAGAGALVQIILHWTLLYHPLDFSIPFQCSLASLQAGHLAYNMSGGNFCIIKH